LGKPSIPVNNDALLELLKEKGIKAGNKNTFKVKFEFVDNGKKLKSIPRRYA
jgi:spore coat-associated protein N